MDIMAVLAIIEKAMAVITTGVEIGSNILPAVKVVEDLISGAKEGTVTDDQLTTSEAELDNMINDFNSPIA